MKALFLGGVIGKTNSAKFFMKEARNDYNNALFEFVNMNDISVIVCFSKAVFWNLPATADEDRDSYEERSLPELGGRRNTIDIYEYAPNVDHGFCNVKLKSKLRVYGIRHPSSMGGFNANAVQSVLSGIDDLGRIKRITFV